MKEKANAQITNKQILVSLLSLSVVLGFLSLIIWIIFRGFSVFASRITEANFGTVATLITALISLLGALTVAYISYQAALKSKRVEREKEIEQELRKQKAPIYEDFTDFLFKIIKEQSKGKETSQEEMLEFVIKFNQKLIVWGGDDVIKSWANFRLNINQEKYSALFTIEDILFSIRYDMGHSNKGLKRGDLLAIFINDISQILDESK